MARPKKCRRICGMPQNTEFGPKCESQEKNIIIMSIDEYEIIRLIDLEKLTQEMAATQMNIARTTVQMIYSSARTKLAECLVNGAELHIAGGDIEVCDQTKECSCSKDCRRCR